MRARVQFAVVAVASTAFFGFFAAAPASANTATLGPVSCASSSSNKIVIKTNNTSSSVVLYHLNSLGDSWYKGYVTGARSTTTSRSSSDWIAGDGGGVTSISYGCTA